MLNSSQNWKNIAAATDRFTTTRVYILPDVISLYENGQVNIDNALDVTESVLSIKIKESIDTKTISSYVGSVALRTVNLKFKDAIDVEGKSILIRAGVTNIAPEIGETPNYEMMDIGIFLVMSFEFDIRTHRTKNVEARDRLHLLNERIPVDELSKLNGSTVGEVAKNWSAMYNIQINGEWEIADAVKINGMSDKGYNTHMEFIRDIAAATMRFVQILDKGPNLMLQFRKMPLTAIENYKLDYVFNIVESSPLIPINRLNLTSELGDNVTVEDEIEVSKNGISELEVKDIEIIRDAKEENIDLLFAEVKGTTYQELTVKYPGDPCIQVGDVITFYDSDRQEYRTIFVTELEFSDTGSWKGTLKSIPLNREIAAANFKGTYDKMIRETIAYVNKVDGIIELAVKEQDEKISTIEIGLQEIDAMVSNIAVGSNIIYNLNFEDDMSGWRFLNDGYLTFGEKARFYLGVLFNSNAIPVETHSLSKSSIRFFRTGTAISPKGYVVPNSVYSYKARRMDNLQRYTVTVIEYNSSNTEIKRTPFNLVSKQYEEFTIQPAQNTMYIALQFDVYDSTVLTLSEQMFARGKPANYQESAEEIKIWAEQKFTIVDDSITLNSQKVDSMNNKIDNATLKLSAEEGVEIWSTNGKGLTIRDSNNEATVLMNTDGTITTKRMVANDAEVNGNITATSGKIAGFDINGTKLIGDGVELDKSQVTIGPAVLSPSSTSVGNSIKIKARVTELGDTTESANWMIFGGKILLNGFTNDAFNMNIYSITPNGITSGEENTTRIGDLTNRFAYIYLQNQPNVSSDIRYKSNIQDIDNDLLDAFEEVMPKLFNTQFDNNIHFGYIAQDVERALYKYCLKKYGYEFANEKVKQFAVLSKSESYLSLLYGELTVIKDAYYHREVERLKLQNQALQSELQAIKQFIGMGEK